ncbi:MAG: DNA recombination protein RmuC [Chloroflexi bacterium]|nr:DNA recombination protein RmuC [Chloroflexota bacterium]
MDLSTKRAQGQALASCASRRHSRLVLTCVENAVSSTRNNVRGGQMDNFTALLHELDGFSFVLGLGLGLVGGFVFAWLMYRSNARNIRRAFENLSEELQKSYGSATQDMALTFRSLSAEALTNTQKEFLLLADRELDKKSQEHATELAAKKALIDTQLQTMSETLRTVPNELEKNQKSVGEVLDRSAESIKESNKSYLNQLTEKADTQTKQYIAELAAKKQLIDQQLEQMSATLKAVPNELEKNQNKVSETLGKSAEHIAESNKNYLNQLTEKAETQSKAHNKELSSKKELIDQRLIEMDVKLGKVEQLVQELQSDRKAQYSALGQQLQSLTSTTDSLQKALADNRARGQWGERMAEDMLNFMGLVEGVNYIKQNTVEAGTRPDFTFLFPKQKSLNMDAKFPLDNYMRYVEAGNDVERKEYSQKFLRDVNQRVTEIQKRDYITPATLDCVLIFIPNEQVYRYIYEADRGIIDNALKQKVIMCSPLTLYVVLAVIRQAAQNFNIEQRSREIIDVVNDIRAEWDKYTGQMDKLERRFKGMHDDFHALTGTRTRQLDRKFVKIDNVTKSNELSFGEETELAQLPEETP